MKPDDRADVKSSIMRELSHQWPVSTGVVEGAVEKAVPEQWRGEVIAAASRLPDDGTWLEIDALWADLDPLLEDVVHG